MSVALRLIRSKDCWFKGIPKMLPRCRVPTTPLICLCLDGRALVDSGLINGFGRWTPDLDDCEGSLACEGGKIGASQKFNLHAMRPLPQKAQTPNAKPSRDCLTL